MNKDEWFGLIGKKIAQMGMNEDSVWFYTEDGIKHEIKAFAHPSINSEGHIVAHTNLIMTTSKPV